MKIFGLFTYICFLTVSNTFNLGKILSQVEDNAGSAFKKIKQKSDTELKKLKQRIEWDEYRGFGRDYLWGAGVPEEVADPEYREEMAEMREDMAEWAPEEYLDDIEYGYGLGRMLHNVKKKVFGVIDQVTNKMHKVFKTVVSSVKSVFDDSDEEKHKEKQQELDEENSKVDEVDDFQNETEAWIRAEFEDYNENYYNHSMIENDQPNTESEDADETNGESVESTPESSEDENDSDDSSDEDQTNTSVTIATNFNRSQSGIGGSVCTEAAQLGMLNRTVALIHMYEREQDGAVTKNSTCVTLMSDAGDVKGNATVCGGFLGMLRNMDQSGDSRIHDVSIKMMDVIQYCSVQTGLDLKDQLEKLSQAGGDEEGRHLLVKREAPMGNAQNPTAVPPAVLIMATAFKSLVHFG